jgi:FMN phosphatase YigB (HAD superfamily)
MSKFTDEQLMVAKAFGNAFGCRGEASRPLLIYGIGRNTEAILRLCGDIDIVGLMDTNATETLVFGKRVIPPSEAAVLRADIVIVARSSVVPLIYTRIAALERGGCRIYSIDGTLLSNAASQYDNSVFWYWGVSGKDVRARILEANHISFDIFDTLVGRKVLRPSDVFGFVGNDFSLVRARAGKQLGVTVSLREIYNRAAVDLKCRELRTERKLLYPRGDVIKLMRYAESLDKTIWLLSDTYYTADELRELLADLGISTDVPILTSCETNTSKEDGSLFAKYLAKTKFEPDKCLHIGDNRYADIEQPKAFGIHTSLVMSAYELLENSSLGQLLNNANTPEERTTIGAFTAEYFASPFALHNSGGIPEVSDITNIYAFVGPLVCAFMQWLTARPELADCPKMLFPARDGYIFRECYERLRKRGVKLQPSVYFKISRRAASVAAIETRNDIAAVASRVFNGTTERFFRNRFGIEIGASDSTLPIAELLLKYESAILDRANSERDEYIRYLRSIGLERPNACGFFDFVASGSVQRAFERITNSRCVGLYFATHNASGVTSATGELNPYSNRALAKHYLALESIFTDPNGTLERFSRGQPCYDRVSNPNWVQMRKIQGRIIDYVMRNYELPHSLTTAEFIFGALFDCNVTEEVKAAFRNEDEYDGTASYNSFV